MNAEINSSTGESEMSDEDRAVVQFLMIHKMVESSTLKSKHEEIFSNNPSISLKETILKIKKTLSYLKGNIQEIVCEITGKTYFVFVYLAPFKCIEKTSYLNSNEISFYDMLVKAIVESENGYILSNDALNQCPDNISKTDAQKALDKFFLKNIFCLIKGCIMFTPLTIADITPFIRSNYPEIVDCSLCRQIIFNGHLCYKCKNKFHKHCLQKWFNNERNNCPLCEVLMDID